MTAGPGILCFIAAAALHHGKLRDGAVLEGIGRSFVNSLTVTIPATIIPDPDRGLRGLCAGLDEAAVPRTHHRGHRGPARRAAADVADSAAQTLQCAPAPSWACRRRPISASGWRTPASACRSPSICSRSYIAGLPKDLIESAQIDGANDFKIFPGIILPLSFPALASFAIFQFLWVWNDLLVAIVFLGQRRRPVGPHREAHALLGSRGGNWEILTASAFVTIIVPLIVFFSLQRYFVRGLLAGSVKGG